MAAFSSDAAESRGDPVFELRLEEVAFADEASPSLPPKRGGCPGVYRHSPALTVAAVHTLAVCEDSPLHNLPSFVREKRPSFFASTRPCLADSSAIPFKFKSKCECRCGGVGYLAVADHSRKSLLLWRWSWERPPNTRQRLRFAWRAKLPKRLRGSAVSCLKWIPLGEQRRLGLLLGFESGAVCCLLEGGERCVGWSALDAPVHSVQIFHRNPAAVLVASAALVAVFSAGDLAAECERGVNCPQEEGRETSSDEASEKEEEEEDGQAQQPQEEVPGASASQSKRPLCCVRPSFFISKSAPSALFRLDGRHSTQALAALNFEFSQPAPEEPSPFTPLVYSPRRLALRSELQDILAKLDERRCRCVASDATDDSRDATSNGYSSSIRNRFARTREGDGGCRGVEDKSSTLTAQETSSLVSSPERGSGGDVPRFFCVLAAGARPLLSLHFLSVHEDSLPLTARKTVSLLAVVAARAAASAAHRLGKFASLKLRKSPKPSSSNADTERESATDALSDCNERAISTPVLLEGWGDGGRSVTQLALCPWNPKLAAVSDSLARVTCASTETLLPLWTLKGYRQAQLAWVTFENLPTELSEAQRGEGLLIFSPRRRAYPLNKQTRVRELPQGGGGQRRRQCMRAEFFSLVRVRSEVLELLSPDGPRRLAAAVDVPPDSRLLASEGCGCCAFLLGSCGLHRVSLPALERRVERRGRREGEAFLDTRREGLL